jgi:hypothetical protein
MVDEKHCTDEEMAGWATSRFHPVPLSISADAPPSA